jgi:hypothetical protein
MSLKNPVKRPGIDPGTVRLVAQRLNRYATPGPGSPEDGFVKAETFRLFEYVIKQVVLD